MRRKLPLLLVVTLVVALAGSAGAATKGSNRPMKASTSGTSTSDATGAPIVVSASSGTGQVSHLGSSAYQLNTTQDWSGYDMTTFPCGVIQPGSTMSFTAANGHMVSGTVSGTVCEQFPPAMTSYVSTLTVTITGGTGRFTGATGTLTGSGVSTATGPGTFADTGSFAGSITY